MFAPSREWAGPSGGRRDRSSASSSHALFPLFASLPLVSRRDANHLASRLASVRLATVASWHLCDSGQFSLSIIISRSNQRAGGPGDLLNVYEAGRPIENICSQCPAFSSFGGAFGSHGRPATSECTRNIYKFERARSRPQAN